jgi:hypothetical protein
MHRAGLIRFIIGWLPCRASAGKDQRAGHTGALSAFKVGSSSALTRSSGATNSMCCTDGCPMPMKRCAGGVRIGALGHDLAAHRPNHHGCGSIARRVGQVFALA